MPADTPDTLPSASTVTFALSALQVPAAMLLARSIEEPIHTLDGPDIAEGVWLTVTSCVV